MKIFQRLFVLASVLALLFVNTISVSAASFGETSEVASPVNLYEDRVTEVTEIDGVNYTFYYFLDKDGNRTISVANDRDSTIDTVKLNKNKIYLNNELIGSIDISLTSNSFIPQDSTWLYVGSSTDRVSWATGTAVATVAAIIAIPLASMGGAGVLAAMGTAAIGTLAASAIGGTIKVTTYRYNSIFMHQLRHDWSFTASTGDYYGVYSYITSPF